MNDPMTANSTPESSDAVVAEMREVCPHEERFGDTIHEWADRLQSAHARELAEQQATIEALRGDLQVERTAVRYAAEQGVADKARADAAMGLLRECLPYVRSWAQNKAGGVHYEQAAPVFALAEKAQQALAGGERKDG